MSTPTPVLQVPASLILDPILPPSAKLIWMVLHFDEDPDVAGRTTLLERRTGLSRKTVSRAMAGLINAGWYSVAPDSGKLTDAGNPTDSRKRVDCIDRSLAGERVCIPAYLLVDRQVVGKRVRIPAGLLADRRVGVRGRIMYGHLQLLSRFRYPTGQFTYAGLSSLTGYDPKTVRHAVAELAAAGWLQASQRNRLDIVRFCLCDPVADRGRADVARAERRLEAAPYLGEALMREYLSFLVDSDDFEDDAAPGFLVNPWTDERMQLDRFYPPGTAFEFNGPQHYGATELFSQAEAAKQRGRDLMKMGICAVRGINLVVVHAEDLNLVTMRRKIGHALPLRDLSGHEQLSAFLESVSRRYRLVTKRKRQT